MVARLPGATDFRGGGGASKKLQTVAPWAIASIYSTLNFNDCHNRQRMAVASDKFRGQVPPKFSCPSGKKVQSFNVWPCLPR